MKPLCNVVYVSICPFVYLLWPLYCLFLLGILKLSIGFHDRFYTKPEKETLSKMSSLVTFDPADLKTLVYSLHILLTAVKF
jgi:hypothetical protein